MTHVIVGLDLSLTNTGIAITDTGIGDLGDKPAIVKRIESSGAADASLFDRNLRLTRHRDAILDEIPNITELVLVEGPSMGAGRQRGTHDRAGLWWLIVYRLHEAGVPTVEVPPATLKKFATGNGAAGKEAMLVAAVRRFPHIDVNTNDEADALWLAAIGAQHAGRPIVDVPKTHLAFLDKIRWPTT